VPAEDRAGYRKSWICDILKFFAEDFGELLHLDLIIILMKTVNKKISIDTNRTAFINYPLQTDNPYK